MLRSELGAKVAKQFILRKGTCALPFIALNWVRKMSLGNNKYHSQFKDFSEESCKLIVETFDKSKNFISPEVGMIYAQKVLKFSL